MHGVSVPRGHLTCTTRDLVLATEAYSVKGRPVTRPEQPIPIRDVSPRISQINMFARDHRLLMQFYAALLGFHEVAQWTSPIFCCLDAGGVNLGFHAQQAYDLLALAPRKPQTETVNVYATFELPDTAAVDLGVERAVALGAAIIKPTYRTYYDSYQVVLADPEGNVFQIVANNSWPQLNGTATGQVRTD